MAQTKLILSVIALVAAFSAGWSANGWRLGEQMAKHERDVATATATASRTARKAEQASAEVVAALDARDAALALAASNRAKSITKEVVRYVESDHAGHCGLSNQWVRIDTAAARGMPTNGATTSAPDAAPSGFTDADALAVITDRSAVCRDTAERLSALQEYVSGQLRIEGDAR